MIEIERKFLITSDAFKKESCRELDIVQGFLNTHPERTVRVRIKGDKAFLTVKGKSNELGTIRSEWETEILVVDAERLLKLCEEGVIEKRRYEVKVRNHIFEVDEFYGNNEGLTIAEIELNSEDEPFDKPAWLGKEVTGDLKYYNSLLSKHPYKNWEL
jgi:CYTH domain-containing protein